MEETGQRFVMLHMSRRLIATATLAALTVGAFGATPVSASTYGGDTTFSALPQTVIAKGGEITLRLTYNCIQYNAPYNASDIIGAVIFEYGVSGSYATTYLNFVVCDGTNRRLTLVLSAFDGGMSGPATLAIGHQGNAAFTQPDGSTGISTEAGNASFRVMVVVAGPK
jgi:hypothetical protein